MAETDLAEFEMKKPQDQTVMNVLYAMHAVAPFTLWSLSLIALIVNYVKRSDEVDRLYTTHHNYMIRTFWWTVLWLALTGPLWFLLFFPGAVAWTVIGAWYIYRFLRGWLRFNDHHFPQ